MKWKEFIRPTREKIISAIIILFIGLGTIIKGGCQALFGSPGWGCFWYGIEIGVFGSIVAEAYQFLGTLITLLGLIYLIILTYNQMKKRK